MSKRRSQITRMLQFFREADLDEVRAVMPLVIEAVVLRKVKFGPVPPLPARKRLLNGTDNATDAKVSVPQTQTGANE